MKRSVVEKDDIRTYLNLGLVKVADIVLRDKNEINPLRVKQQVNMGLNIKRYQEALTHLRKTGKLDLSIISIHKPSKDPEQERWFFHPIHGKFFGFARDLVKKYPEVDEGNLYRVSRGKAKQTRGWVIDKDNVKNVSCVNNIWRFKED